MCIWCDIVQRDVILFSKPLYRTVVFAQWFSKAHHFLSLSHCNMRGYSLKCYIHLFTDSLNAKKQNCNQIHIDVSSNNTRSYRHKMTYGCIRYKIIQGTSTISINQRRNHNSVDPRSRYRCGYVWAMQLVDLIFVWLEYIMSGGSRCTLVHLISNASCAGTCMPEYAICQYKKEGN